MLGVEAIHRAGAVRHKAYDKTFRASTRKTRSEHIPSGLPQEQA